MSNQIQPQPDLEDTWKALSNPLRRQMLDALREQPLTTGDLVERFQQLSRFAVMQHLKVLEQGRLIVHRKQGRQRFNYLNPLPIQQIYHRWVRQYESNWAEALVSLKASLENDTDNEEAG
ncbi:MAG: metalloregulator ArsR/SmtB family transcription factor [Wenzhouxiangellaceae bacterium]